MTHNQIEFQELKETIRHNLAVESETGRHNVVTEGQEGQKIYETGRHNVATEKIETAKVEETGRHNRVTEQLGFENLFEVVRHNKVSESQTDRSLDIQAQNVGARYLELGIKERAQSLSEWSSQFIPDDVQSRRIQALAASTSAGAALQQATTAAQLLPYTQRNLSSQTSLNNAKALTEINERNLKDAQASKAAADSAKAYADADLARSRTEHQDWENQGANLFIEQGQNITGVVGNLFRMAK